MSVPRNGAELRQAALQTYDTMAVLDGWSKPGFYWFVMPPKPGKSGPYTLFMSTGKAFESELTDPLLAHKECREKAADYIRETQKQVESKTVDPST